MLLPPMTDYHEHIKTYSRPALPDTFNFAEVIDNYAKDADRMALIWANSEGEERRFTYKEISEESQRIANTLKAQGVTRGDRVIVMLPRIPEWQMTMLAIFRLGAVAIPCITMLQKKDIEYRINLVTPKAVVTVRGETEKFSGLLGADVARFSIGNGEGTPAEGWQDFATVVAEADPVAPPEKMKPDEPSIIYFTSGSTGQPKGVVHSAYFARGFLEIAAYWFDLNSQSKDDLCWGTADTGWAFSATGTLITPWLAGICAFSYDGPFEPKVRLELMQKYGVTLYAASASEYRWMLGEDIESYDLSKLRLSITGGESLDAPTAYGWMERAGSKFLESYGQTESFMSVANFSILDIKPGSMGLPMPGMPVDVIDEETFKPLGPGEIGHIALRAPFESLMLGYWQEPEKTAECFRTDASGQKWLITGDLARKDNDGYFWYEGRSDDVINTAGYRIGPAEVEGAVMAHDAVMECAAVASPDPKRGVVVKAFVVLHDGQTPSDELARDIQNCAKEQTAPYKYPRKIEFLSELPKTVSGKVKRKELRDKEMAG